MASRPARRHRGGRKGSTRGGSTDAGAGRSTTTAAAVEGLDDVCRQGGSAATVRRRRDLNDDLQSLTMPIVEE